MSDRGLVEVPNPSALFLADRDDPTNSEAGGRATGAAVFAGIEGTRPLLVEVQALVAPSLLGTPRRAVVGWDATRLAMLTAGAGPRLRPPVRRHQLLPHNPRRPAHLL